MEHGGYVDAGILLGSIVLLLFVRESSAALLPPAVGFIFDRESRDERRRADLVRESGGLVSFLPCRMYENYLLNPRAIAWLLSELLSSSESGGVSAEEVKRWIDQHGKDFAEGGTLDSAEAWEEWLTEVHGANVLKVIFEYFSEGTVEYRKTEHTPWLTRWLCENEPELEPGTVTILFKRSV